MHSQSICWATKEIKNIAAERLKERKKEKRKIQLIWDAIQFFKEKMENNTLALNEILEKYEKENNFRVKDWEGEY